MYAVFREKIFENEEGHEEVRFIEAKSFVVHGQNSGTVAGDLFNSIHGQICQGMC